MTPGRATSDGPELRLDGLGHRFGDGSWLFREVQAVLAAGSVTAVTGPSGCGKSTLLAIAAGVLDPAAGRAVRSGVDRVGWVFQNPHGVPRRTALDHVTLPLLARGATRRAADEEGRALLDRFGLAQVGARAFRHLSGGEAQRLMLARAVAIGPGLLLVDEPTAQLDRETADGVSRTLAHTARAGSVVLVATHDPRARDACDGVLDLGSARAEPRGGAVGRPVGAGAPAGSPGTGTEPRSGTVS
ncbi:MAG TPA: ATP-binding cassette domain-containing protein [Cellulomonas sp.]